MKIKCYNSETRKTQDAGPMSPISGIVLIMKDTRAISVSNMDYKGIGEDRNQPSMINDRLLAALRMEVKYFWLLMV